MSLSVSLPTSAPAQPPASAARSASAKRAPLRVELDRTATHTDSARIVRLPRHAGPSRLILPMGSASARLLTSSVLAYTALMEHEGDEVRDSSITMVASLAWVPDTELRAAARILARLRGRADRVAADSAVVSTTLWVPTRAERARLRAQRRGGPGR